MSAERPPNRKLQLAIDDDVAAGRYANLAAVSVGENEFIFDFAFLQPGNANAKIHSRIIVSPGQAKQLHRLLGSRVAFYEERKGEIAIPPPAPTVKH